MDERRSLDALLSAVDGVRKLGPRDWIDVQRWLEEGPPASEAEFRAGFASLLARNEHEWERVARLADQYLSGALDADGATCRADIEPQAARSQPPGWRVRERRRLRRLVGLRRRRLVVAALAVAVLGALALAAGLSGRGDPEPAEVAPVVGEPEVGGATPQAPVQPEERASSLRLVEPDRTVPHVARSPWRPRPGPLAAAAVLTLLLLSLGYRWRHLEGPTREERRQRAQQGVLASRTRRIKLEKEAAERGDGPVRLWEVEPAAPLERAAIEDSAALLGSIRRWSGTREVDVDRTLEGTIRAGGLLSVGFLDRAIAVPLLVLLDEEEGEHPWLLRIRRLVEAWRALGLQVLLYTFHGDPDTVRDEHTREPLPLEDLSRRAAGLPLLVFSRRLSPLGYVSPDAPDPSGAEAWLRGWLDHLPAWPRRAWVDPDPWALRDRRRAKEVRLLDDHGLRRFPFSEDGVRAAAAWLAGAEGIPPVTDPTLPAVGDGEQEEALALWALAAAEVPEPSWDQLEAIRLECPVLHSALPGPHAVRWLMAYIKGHEENRDRSTSDRGDQLYMDPRLVEKLRDRLWEGMARSPELREFRLQVNRLLERQLPSAMPERELARAWWQFKVYTVRARLHPEEAGELLAPLLAGPLLEEAREELEAELARQDRHPGLARLAWPEEVRARLREELAPSAGMRLADLLLGARVAWPTRLRRLGWAVALVALVVAGWLAPGLLDLPARARGQALLPATWEVQIGGEAAVAGRGAEEPPASVGEEASAHPWPAPLAWGLLLALLVAAGSWKKIPPPGEPEPKPRRTWPATPSWPDMLEIRPGAFVMGSPEDEEGRLSRERLHEVRITRSFALSRTPVTQGVYGRVMGSNPASIEGEDLPVVDVSWFDAVAFCNRLSELEGLRPAYRIEGEEVEWIEGADGYRLPTEAEWEYAARAGTQEVWAGTSSKEELPRYANLGGRLAPVGGLLPNAWGLHDMSGNVWEWCWDRFGDYPDSATDPTGPPSGSGRVFRGGSWWLDPRLARVAYRFRRHPSDASGAQGFRLARSLP